MLMASKLWDTLEHAPPDIQPLSQQPPASPGPRSRAGGASVGNSPPVQRSGPFETKPSAKVLVRVEYRLLQQSPTPAVRLAMSIESPMRDLKVAACAEQKLDPEGCDLLASGDAVRSTDLLSSFFDAQMKPLVSFGVHERSVAVRLVDEANSTEQTVQMAESSWRKHTVSTLILLLRDKLKLPDLVELMQEGDRLAGDTECSLLQPSFTCRFQFSDL